MKVSILGAGVGGLCSAIALGREGFDVSIYEKHPAVRDVGAGIVCWPNATFVLKELGMLPDIERVSGKLTNMCRMNKNGNSLGSLNIEKLSKKMGHHSYSVLRKDLMAILMAHAKKQKVKMFFNFEAISIKSIPDGFVQVKFDNGKLIESDLIIGADGRMKSISRNYVNGNNIPQYQGFINWVGVYRSQSSTAVFSEFSVRDYWGVGKRFGIVPVSETVAYWAGAVSSENIEKTSQENYTEELMTIFHDWPELINKIIKQSSLADIHKIYVHDHNPIKTWHKNNVLLIGDAAHAPLPTSGQGACQAMEDAWHLVELLKQGGQDLPTILDSFTKIRQAKTEGIILGARQFASSLFSTNAEACNQRDLKSIATDYDKVIEGMSKGWASGLPI